MSSPISSRRVVLVSFLVDVSDIVLNLIVALFTGSAVVFAEMALGLADTFGSGLLVIGERRCRRPRTERHPLGHSREVFFWALLSALSRLVLGAGLCAWKGLKQLRSPEPLESPGLALAVLLVALCTNGYTVMLELVKLGGERNILRAWRNASLPLVQAALWRDAIGTLSAVLGLFAVGLYLLTGQVLFDAVGALVIGLLSAVLAIALVHRFGALIVGRSIPRRQAARIRSAVLDAREVEAINGFAAVHDGIERVLVELDLDLAEGLTTTEVERVLDDIEKRVRAVAPQVSSIRVDLNSPAD
jgi:cation diffusion facilitator family transporter